MEVLSARVQKALDLPGGLSVAQAAERLEVSEPTVRKWLVEGLLERVEDHKPVEIAQRSVIEVERALDTGPRELPGEALERGARRLPCTTATLLGQEWVREGVEQLRHGSRSSTGIGAPRWAVRLSRPDHGQKGTKCPFLSARSLHRRSV